MIAYLRKKWSTYKNEKSLFGKMSDALFILFLLALIIPTSRKEISSFAIRMISTSPRIVNPTEQKIVSTEAYHWQLATLDGEVIQLANLKGKPIFVNFWATWCPPCVAELPEIQALYHAYGNRVAFVLVTDEPAETIRAFFKQKNYTLPVYFIHSATPDIFVTNSIPTTYIISPENKIVVEKKGAAKWNSDSMHDLLDGMIQK